MRVVFAGTPEAAVPSLLALLDSAHQVVAVLTRPDAPAGRRRTLTPSPVRQVAQRHGVEVLTPRLARDPQFRQRLSALAPDVCAVVAYGAIIPADVLCIPPAGWVNLHFSLLPAWRGASPVQRAIMAGDELTGATTFRLEETLDSGPVYGSLTEPIHPTDTAGDLLERLAASGAGLLEATLDGIARAEATPVDQPSDGVSFAPKLTAQDARVAWDRPEYAVDRQIRGCTPAPGAWTMLGPDRVKLGVVQPRPGAATTLAPGELHTDDEAVSVGTGNGSVRLGWVQPPGKRAMPAGDWARGARLSVGDRFR